MNARGPLLLLAGLLVVASAHAEDPPARDRRAKQIEARVEALRRERAAETAPEAGVALDLAIGTALANLRWEHDRLSRRAGYEADVPKEVLAAHARAAASSAEEAIRIFRRIESEHPKSAAAAEALWRLGGLLMSLERYEAAIEATRALLERYADAEISVLVACRPGFSAHRRIGAAHAALGRRREALGAFGESLLAAASPVARRVGFANLVDYEPRLLHPAFPRILPEAARAALDGCRADAEVHVTLSARVRRLPPGGELAFEYRIDRPPERSLRGYCLLARAFPAEFRDEDPEDALGRIPWYRRHARSDAHVLFPREGSDTDEGTCRIAVPAERGSYYLVAAIADAWYVQPRQRAPGRFPAMVWCEPLEFTVEGD